MINISSDTKIRILDSEDSSKLIISTVDFILKDFATLELSLMLKNEVKKIQIILKDNKIQGASQSTYLHIEKDIIYERRSSESTILSISKTTVQAIIASSAAAAILFADRKSTRLNSSHPSISRMPSSA